MNLSFCTSAIWEHLSCAGHKLQEKQDRVSTLRELRVPVGSKQVQSSAGGGREEVEKERAEFPEVFSFIRFKNNLNDTN